MLWRPFMIRSRDVVTVAQRLGLHGRRLPWWPVLNFDRIRSEFEPRDEFDYPTVDELGARIRESGSR